MNALARVADVFVLTDAPTAPASRAWSRDAAANYAREQGWNAVSEPDFEAALSHASEIGRTVVVTGSFHTVGDAMARLDVDPVSG